MKRIIPLLVALSIGFGSYYAYNSYRKAQKPRAYTDAKKLALLQKGIGSNSQKFLQKFVKQGNCIVDVGCGTGEVTRIIADMVTESGLVVAIDKDKKALADAKKIGSEKGYKNIVYLNKATKDLSPKLLQSLIRDKNIDAVYSRILLIFQKKPTETLQFMYNILPKGGILACEEVIGKTESSNPKLPIFEKVTKLKVQLIKAKGGNANIGENLKDMFKRLKLRKIKEFAETQARFNAEIGKKFIGRSMKKKIQKIVKHGLATKSEMINLIKQVKESQKIKEYIFPQIIQVMGIK